MADELQWTAMPSGTARVPASFDGKHLLQMPYIDPMGAPRDWRDDVTRTLLWISMQLDIARRDAINEDGRLSSPQIKVARAYCEYYVNAPMFTRAWKGDCDPQLTWLRTEVFRVQTQDDLLRWLDEAARVGIRIF